MTRGNWTKAVKKTGLFLLMLMVLFCVKRNVFAASGGTGSAYGGYFRAGQESSVRVEFISRAGKVYSSLTRQTKLGDTLLLPAVPGYEGKKNSGWKLEKDAPDIDGFEFMEGDALRLTAEESLIDYVENGVLRFYAIEPYKLTLWNNSGTGKFQQLYVFPGNKVKLPDFPNSKYKNFGWTNLKKGTSVKYEIGQKIAVTKNTDLYIIRYSVTKLKTVTFLSSGGASNKNFKALESQVLQNKKLKLPSVPAAAGYTNLGWSTKKNATKVAYAVGASVTVKKNLTFYAVRKKLPVYKVAFNNNAGTSTSKAYSALGLSAYKGKRIVLPELPKVKGYTALGWTTVRKGAAAKYKAGAKITVVRNLHFYAVYKKITYYTVSFLNSSGTNTSVFAALKKTAASGGTVTLPAVPAKSGYIAEGWSTQKNSSAVSYQAGAKLKVTKNITLYAVYKSSVTITLYKNNGALYKTLKVGKGEYFTLPAVQSKLPYTMMGWSSTQGKTAAPEYEVGESMRVTTDRKFYTVVFNRNTEPDYPAASLPGILTSGYKKVIFVGDSRTRRMYAALTQAGASGVLKGVSFLAKDGEGLGWFKTESYTKLLQEIENAEGLPAAVIFNLGINDLSNVDNYVTYFQSIAPELKKRGCDLYYMSLNPLNSANLKASGKSARKEETVRSFNGIIRSGLCSGSGASYTYIDVYDYLIKNGYGTDSSSTGVDSGTDDGLHYTVKTYKRIYKYCMEFLGQHR